MEPWLFTIVLAVGVVEVILSLTWNRFYFSSGIPVFRRALPALDPAMGTPSVSRLDAALSKSAFPPLVFRLLEANILAFRERAWGGGLRIGYTPVMHGELVFSRSGARVEVVGRLNWFTLVFTVFALLAVADREAHISFVLFLVGLLALIYWIQAKRFSKVAEIAVAEWSARSAV